MKSQIGVLAATLAVLAWAAPAHAQKATCSLLTADELSAAIGAKPTDGREGSIVVDSGPSKGETIHQCAWMVTPFQGVRLNYIRQSTGAQREEGLATIRQMLNDLKDKGWSEKFDASKDPTCVTMAPPKAMPQMPNVESCMTEQKGQAVGVAFMHPGGAQPVDKVKTLLKEAVARLP